MEHKTNQYTIVGGQSLTDLITPVDPEAIRNVIPRLNVNPDDFVSRVIEESEKGFEAFDKFWIDARKMYIRYFFTYAFEMYSQGYSTQMVFKTLLIDPPLTTYEGSMQDGSYNSYRALSMIPMKTLQSVHHMTISLLKKMYLQGDI